jgi:hypothetical protein
MSTLLARFDQINDADNFYVPLMVEYQDGEYWGSTPLLEKWYFTAPTLDEVIDRLIAEIKESFEIASKAGESPTHAVVLTAWLRLARDVVEVDRA